MANVINATSTGNGGLVSTGDDSGILNIQTNETTAITVDASQRVGVGVTPSAWTTSIIQLKNSGYRASGNALGLVSNAYYDGTWKYIATDYAQDYYQQDGAHVWRYAGLGTAGNSVSWTEGMRIDNGNLLVARTSSFTPNSADNTKGFGILADSGQTLVNATGSVNALIVNNTNTNNRLLSFRSANTEVGGVTITSSTATFNGTSDSRLKEDLGVSTDTSVIDNTIIHDFKWTRDGTQGKGVFAQEAYEVYPLAVSKGSDELNESGNLSNPWQVNYSQYIPDLIVYCQQLKKTVDTQAETINALTARIVALEGQ